MKKLSKSILVIIIALAITLSLFACGSDTIYNCNCDNDNTCGNVYNCDYDNTTGGTGGGNSNLQINAPSNAWNIQVIYGRTFWSFVSFQLVRLNREYGWETITQAEYDSYSWPRRRDSEEDFVFELPRDNVVPSWLEEGSYVVIRFHNTFHRVLIASVSATYYQTVAFNNNIMTITAFSYLRHLDKVISRTFITSGLEGVMREYVEDTLVSLTAGLAFIEYFVSTDWLYRVLVD
ncbi:MAG: hypothetical protein FWC80_07465 [Firmicutes bacterium]|nr:hypothetical protein [Bacillota bacterium]